MSAANEETETFVPKVLAPFKLDTKYVLLYPDLRNVDNPVEKAYGFHISVNNIASCSHSWDFKYQALQSIGMFQNDVDDYVRRFAKHVESKLKDVSCLSVVSYHTVSGLVEANALANNGNLKPLNSRPGGIQYAKLMATIPFIGVGKVTDPNAKGYIEFFVKLKQGSFNGKHGFNGTTTWIDTQATFNDATTGFAGEIGYPFTLTASSNLADANANANIDEESKRAEITRLCKKHAWDTVVTHVKMQLCPTQELSTPSVMLQKITMVKIDPDTHKETRLSVLDYFIATKNAAMLFTNEDVYPVDVVSHFIDNLAAEIRTKVKQVTPAYNSLAPDAKDKIKQMEELNKWFGVACNVEVEQDDLKRKIQTIATQSLASAQSLIATDATALPSVYEKAADKFGKPKFKHHCFGCGSEEHTFKLKDKVVCPLAQKDPAVMKQGNEKLAEVRAKIKAKKKQKNKERKSAAALLGKLDEDTIDYIIGLKKSKSNDGGAVDTKVVNFPLILQDTVQNLNLLLPITIARELPHIKLELGPNNVSPRVAIDGVLDTGAQVSVGNAAFHLALAKKFPHIVRAVYNAGNEYDSLTLKGVVDNGDSKKKEVVTTLDTVFEYYLGYVAEDGKPYTWKVALGKDVGVNTIFGVAFLKSANAQIDIKDGVVDIPAFQVKPFPITWMPPKCEVPKEMHTRKVAFTRVGEEWPHVSINQIEEIALNFSNEVAAMVQKEGDSVRVHTDSASALESAVAEQDKFAVESEELGNSDLDKFLQNKYEDENLCTFPSVVEKQDKKVIVIEKRAKASAKFKQSLWREDDDTPADAKQDCLRVTELPPPNPTFLKPFGTVEGDEKALELLQISHLDQDLRNRVVDMVKRNFPVFRPSGVRTPIRGFEYVINTGRSKPTCIPKPRYGMQEAIIMDNHIKEYLEAGMIEKDDPPGPYGAKITLAPKPHQEHVTEWEKFVWRFCINYMFLNKVTRPSQFPIPRCDDATDIGNSIKAKYFALFDADSGYNQISIYEKHRYKTAFFGPNATKWRWKVLPFGLVNGPPFYVAMMHFLREEWNEKAKEKSITINGDNNTSIIVDDTLLFSEAIDELFKIAQCIFDVSIKYHLTWKLKKVQFLPKVVEFVGVDLSEEGNSPAQSKFQRLKEFDKPTTPREAMSWIGFCIFYVKWIPYFEDKIKSIRELIKNSGALDEKFQDGMWTKECDMAWTKVTQEILSKPILRRAVSALRFYLKTDFSAKGIGYALCQPQDNPRAIKAMNDEDKGGECQFEKNLKDVELRLLPVGFGSRKTKGNEEHFHAFPGEATAAAFGITKNRHYLWGRIFTLITDHAALTWLLTYNGNNHAIRRLQIELSDYWYTIVHRPGYMLGDADFMSRSGKEYQFDQLSQSYTAYAQMMRNKYPPEAEDPDDLDASNMPGRRSVSKRRRLDPEISVNTAYITQVGAPIPMTCIPIRVQDADMMQPKSTLDNSSSMEITIQAHTSNWCLVEPKFGHWIECATSNAFKFSCIFAVESTIEGRDMLKSKWKVPLIVQSTEALHAHLAKEKFRQKVHGYYACLWVPQNEIQMKSMIHQQLALIRTFVLHAGLQVICLELKEASSMAIEFFRGSLAKNDGFEIAVTTMSSDNFSDAVEYEATILYGRKKEDKEIILPAIIEPPRSSTSFMQHLNMEFNRINFCMPNIEHSHAIQPMRPAPMLQRKPHVLYQLRSRKYMNMVEQPSLVYDIRCQAPMPSRNYLGIFHNLFGIQCQVLDPRDNVIKSFIRAISIIEYTKMYGYSYQFCQVISTKYKFATNNLVMTMPFNMMTSILTSLDKMMQPVLDAEFEAKALVVGKREQITIPASSLLIQGLIPSATPSEDQWKEAYHNDTDCAKMISIIKNNLISSEHDIQTVNPQFRQYLRDKRIEWKDGRIVINEPIAFTRKTVAITVIPFDLRQVIFRAFHCNPLGAHYSAYYTLHRIRLRYYWPHMYRDVTNWIKNCAACVLRNKNSKPKSELLYTFPMTEPMAVVHLDAWTPGDITAFAHASKALMIQLCNMTGFAGAEPIIGTPSAKEFARSSYMIQLRYGLSQLLIVDADSKFRGVFEEMAKLLNVQLHTAARGHHDSIMVERFNRFMNAALTITCSERESVRTFVEQAMMAIYAWNSAPVIGTDISRSLVCTGREFKFPIDFVAQRHRLELPSTVEVENYAMEQEKLLEKSRQIFKILVSEHRTMHREYRNAQRVNPRKFNLGDIVFTNVQVQSKKKDGRVGKLSYVKRGPFIITKVAEGGSYLIRKLNSPPSASTIKKHGNDLYFCEDVIVPYRNLQTSDQKFSDIDKCTVENPFMNIGIRDYEPARPWAASAAPAVVCETKLEEENSEYHFPTLEELDAEYYRDLASQTSNVEVIPTSVNNHCPANNESKNMSAVVKSRAAPNLAVIVDSLYKSQNKLLFIAYAVPQGQRREWQLVQVNMEESIRKNPDCLSNGRFLVAFYICHPQDNNNHPAEQRYWKKYQKGSISSRLHENYKLIEPSAVSEIEAERQNLTPYTEWIDITDQKTVIHGPFNFAIIHDRRTRDLVDLEDWLSLIQQQHMFENESPDLTRVRSNT